LKRASILGKTLQPRRGGRLERREGPYNAFTETRILCLLGTSAVKFLIVLPLFTYNRNWIVLLDLGHSLN